MLNKKKRLILFVSGLVIFLAISILAIIYLSGSFYRTNLPQLPDLKVITPSLQEQILAADKKACLNPSSDNLGKLGMVYHSSAYYDKATQCYRLAVQKNEDNWIWSYYLGYLNLELGNSEESIENFSHVIKKNPASYLSWYYTGKAYYNLGMVYDAEKYFNKVAANYDQDFNAEETIRENYFPLRTYAMFDLARIYMNTNRLDNAENKLKEIIDDQIRFGPAYRMLGNVYSMKGDLPLSNYYNIRAKDLSDFVPPVDLLADKIALVSRSELYLLKEIDIAVRSINLEWALKLCNQALQYIPDNKYLISKAIRGYLTLSFGEQALSLLDQHMDYFSNDYDELIEIAGLLKEKGFPSQALMYFSLAKKLKPQNPKLPLWLGEKGFNFEAVSLMYEQLEKDPVNIDYLSNAVIVLISTGQKEMAKPYLEKLKQLSPSNPGVKKFTGKIAEEEGNMTEAIAIYEDVFRDDPKDLSVNKVLFNIYINHGMWDKAIDLFRKALEINPNEPFLLEGLGTMLLFCPDPELRNMKDGREYSERAYININSHFEIRLSAARNLATAYAELGDKQKAVAYMETTINLANKGNVAQDYLSYFENLKKQFNLPD